MKERLQNITQKISKERILTIVLVAALIVTSIPFAVLGGNNAAFAKSGANWGSVIGNTASFNTEKYTNARITDDPANFGNDDWGNDDNFLEFDDTESLEGIVASYEYLPLVITNYYCNEETYELWYKVEAAPGYKTPTVLQEKPWVFQNYTDYYEDPGMIEWNPDSLYIDQTGATYVYNEDGNAISELDFYPYEAHKLHAETTLQGGVDYQWQIYSDGEWINIHEATKKDFRLSYGMLLNILDENLTTKVRVVTTSATKSLESDPVTVKYIPTNVNEDVAVYSLRSTATNNQQMVKAVADEVSEKVTVTVKFVYGENNQQIDEDKIFEVQKDSNLETSFALPELKGYDAYLEDDTETIYTEYTINETVTGDKTITFKYWPAKVNYTVIYYWQDVEGDNYTEHERYTTQGFTGSIAEVEDKEYAGLYQLLYEEVPIASDGSTVIEVYYDRMYYKMTFDLSGGYGVQPIYARYGTEVVVSNPTRAGYVFVGWDYVGQQSSDDAGDGIADQLPTTVPAQHTAYKAIWEATDAAKVTIVYWGENANDEGYSYIESQEIYVAPGTELTYGTDKPICGLEPHSHGEDCETKCGLAIHTHSDANNCYGKCSVGSHTHTSNCYTVTYRGYNSSTNNTVTLTAITNSSTIEDLEDRDAWNNGVVRTGYYNNYRYYMKLDGVWYQLTRNYISISEYSTVTVTYKDDCPGAHIHTDACLSCTIPVHAAHTATCYTCLEHTHTANCYLQGANLDSDLWTYVDSDTVTVAADGSTVMNVYYDRTTFTITFKDGGTVYTINEKWDADISEHWPIEGTNGTTYDSGERWSPSGSSTYKQVLVYLAIMPAESFTLSCSRVNYDTFIMHYMVESLPGETGTAYNGKYFKEDFKVIANYNHVTKAEDFFDLDGFTQYGSTPSFGNGTSLDIDGGGDVYFYYTRNSYELVFNNGEENTRSEMVKYEASLSPYSTYVPEVPSFYEPGSVKFDGWYLNPECTGDKYVLSEHTMPADNVLLYAKWTPVTHTVRFFFDETTVRDNEHVYTQVVDGQTVKYMSDIEHGSRIEGDKVPADPTRGEYIFVGWFYEDANGNEQMWDFENTTVIGDTDIYAKWSSNTLVQYTVNFVYVDEAGNKVQIADPITGSALGGSSKTFKAKGNTELYDRYQEGYFPKIDSHTIVMDLENLENNTFTFEYIKKDAVPYTVYYVTTEPNDVSGSQEVTIGDTKYYTVAATKTVEDNKKAIVTETYERVSGYLPNTYQQTLVIDPNGENIIIFQYVKDETNGMYVVHYYTENVDGTYSEHSIFEGRGEKGSKVNATIKDIENFTHNPNATGTLLEGTISVENVLELHVYYDRNKYPYKVQYLEEGTNKPLADDKVVRDKVWEALVTETAISIDGYTRVGNDTKSIEIRKDTEDPTVNIITFYYAENKAALTIKKNYPEGADYSIDENQTYIFTVKGVDEAGNEKAKDIELTVTIHGAGEVKITDLPAGKYTVTENEAWSWRYDAKENSRVVELDPGEKTGLVEFENERGKIYWLDGDSFKVNIFRKNNQ